MAKENENTQLDAQIVERLNNLDWPSLEAATGITRASVEANAAVARQLAFGSMTDLVYGHTADVSGAYSLRAMPGEDGKPGKIKAYTIEPEKKKGQTLFLFGSPIYSEKAINNLFERTNIKTLDKDGKEITVNVRANANAGIQVAVADPETKEKKYYLVSIHEPTNRIVGVPVEAVEKMVANMKVYGVELSDEQKKSLVKGDAVIVSGCTNKDGETFSACVQFDAAKRQLVSAHPAWLRQAQRAGVDTGIKPRTTKKEAAQVEKPAEAKKEGKKTGRKMSR